MLTRGTSSVIQHSCWDLSYRPSYRQQMSCLEHSLVAHEVTLRCCLVGLWLQQRLTRNRGETATNAVQGGKGSYIEKTRVALLKNLKASPSNMWPTSLPFSFRNSAKVYGSPMLDAAIRASQNPQQSVAGGSDPQLSAVVSEMAAAYVQPQS